MYAALAVFGAPLPAFEVAAGDFATYDGFLQIGLPPFRIDVLNEIDRVTFDEAVADRQSFDLHGGAIPVIGLTALLANERAVGHEQDLADVKALTER